MHAQMFFKNLATAMNCFETFARRGVLFAAGNTQGSLPDSRKHKRLIEDLAYYRFAPQSPRLASWNSRP